MSASLTVSAPMPVRLVETKLIQRGALVAVVGVQIGKLVLHDVQIFASNGRVWINSPSRPQIRDGQVVKGDTGKVLYVPVVEWTDRESRERFQHSVIAAFEVQHGSIVALMGGAP